MENQKEKPNQSDPIVTTKTVQDYKDEFFQKTKDAATLEIMKPVLSRLKTRVKQIQKESQAVHTKIMKGRQAMWVTKPPKMYITSLDSTIQNGVGTITYGVYSMENGKKKIIEHKAKIKNAQGIQVEVVTSANYEIKETVIETITLNKPIHVERIQNV